METVDRKEGSYVLFDPNDMRRTLNTFISKRTMLLLYFKNFYEDEAYYFNTLEFNTQAIMLYIQENEKLKRRY